MQSMTDVERQAWGIFFKVLRAWKEAKAEGATDAGRTLAFARSVLYDPSKPNTPMSGAWQPGRDDYIVVDVGMENMAVRWVYRSHSVAVMRYAWGWECPRLELTSNGVYSEATRTRLCAAMRVTQGWEIHAKKEGQRRTWYVSSVYMPFPATKADFSSCKEKGYIVEFQDGMTLPAPF